MTSVNRIPEHPSKHLSGSKKTHKDAIKNVIFLRI